MKHLLLPAGLYLLLCLPLQTFAQPISYQTIASSGLDEPMDIAIPPNVFPADGSNHMFIAQRDGLIRLWNGSAFSDFLDIGSLVSSGGERGLLSMTFHQDYDGVTNRNFFIYYTNLGGDLVIARYRTAPGDSTLVEGGSGQVIINPIEHSSLSNHNGGDINFGPDGFLYLTTGDGGGSGDPGENAQNASSFLGKLLRFDVDAAIPIAAEVVDIGLRNPFRWSFDRVTGNAWIGDVGQGSWEEISIKPSGTSGLNFGWDCYEGNVVFETLGCGGLTFTSPDFVYPNGAGAASVIGGYVYRGTEFPELYGWYIATDYFSGTIYRRSPTGTWTAQANSITSIVSFGEAPDGTLYAINQLGDDDLFKLVVTGPLPVVLTRFSGIREGNVSKLLWTTASEHNTSAFKIEYSKTPSGFRNAGTVAASGNENGDTYNFDHAVPSNGDLYYRLVVEDNDGSYKYSSIIRLSGDKAAGVKIYPTVIRNRVVNMQTSLQADNLKLFNANGKMVFEKVLKVSGTIAMELPSLPAGIYIVQVMIGNKPYSEKIIIN